MHISWGSFYEGRTDALYFNVLLPRTIEEILRQEGIRPYDVGLVPAVELGINDRRFISVTDAICERANEFHLLFVHADGGGRAQRQSIEHRREALVESAVQKCGFDAITAIYLSPVKELEAWAIADPEAIKSAFGLSSLPQGLLPASARQAELVDDPKRILQAISDYAGRRRGENGGILVRIAQEQDLTRLRQAPSFQQFENSLRVSLRHIGCIP